MIYLRLGVCVSIKVLIVEDEPISAEYLKSIIESDIEFEVVSIVDSEEEAIDAIHSFDIDIIFMDIMIKGSVSGAEAALRISILKEDILIIFMTAYSEKEMIEYAVESHAFAYLLKPYRPNEILATLELAKDKIKHKRVIPKDSNIVELINNYSYNKKEQKLYYYTNEVEMTQKEREIIDLLIENIPNPVDKYTILDKLNISELSLRALLYRLRKRTSKELIQSIKRLGYKILTLS